MNINLLDPSRYCELPYEVNPATSIVVVAEDEEGIKGYWVAQLVVHTEPVWLSPELRSGLTGIKLYAALLAALTGLGIKEFYAFADRDEIDAYAQRLGLKILPYTTYRGVVPERNDQCPQLSQDSSQPAAQ